MKPALIIGSTCVDVIINIPHLPVTQEDIHPTAQTMSIGGCSYNVAYMMRLLHAPCTHISPVGTGMYGDFAAKCLTESGVPISVRIPDRDNGCCYCLVEESGERTFMAWHGVEYTFQKEWMEPYPASDFGICYICGLEIEEPTGISLIEYLEEHPELPVFFAPGPRLKHIAPEKLERVLALHPILHLNEQEAGFLSEYLGVGISGQETPEEPTPAADASISKTAGTLHAVTGNSVIITLGKNGCFCKEKDGSEYLLPSIPVDHVVDTIGAGDSHAGTILACLTKGMNLHSSIAYANQVAAAVVQVPGIGLKEENLPVPIDSVP